MGEKFLFTEVVDLTTNGIGVHPDAQALVYQPPEIRKEIPGLQWTGEIGSARAVIRLPDANLWNGKLWIGGIPAVRSEFAMDHLLSDIVLQRGYAYAACDKATPGVILRDPVRSMNEWAFAYEALTERAGQVVTETYGVPPAKTYIAGASNGGYVTRVMLERYSHLFDGGVDWEGVLWHPDKPHLLATLPVYVTEFPVYQNWRGDRTKSEQMQAYEAMLEAGLPEKSMPFWDTYYKLYWVVSLWLYGRNLDPDYAPFAAEWSNDWLANPSALAAYPAQERREILRQRISPIANSGNVTKPLLTVAGSLDTLVPFQNHAVEYRNLVEAQGCARWHRLYEIENGNHVDGLLRENRKYQQPVLPYFEAALYHLEAWVEQGKEPPESGRYSEITKFARDSELLSYKSGGVKEWVQKMD